MAIHSNEFGFECLCPSNQSKQSSAALSFEKSGIFFNKTWFKLLVWYHNLCDADSKKYIRVSKQKKPCQRVERLVGDIFLAKKPGVVPKNSLPIAMGRIDKNPEKCSAVSTIERGMPDFDYSHLVKELRSLIIPDIAANPEKFGKDDTQRVYYDDWFLARYLLRVKLDVNEAHKMLRQALEFRNLPKIAIIEFPHEFYKIGAIFVYEPDRKGNIPVWVRIRFNQKIAIVQEFLKAFLFKVIEEADRKANGKGIVLVFDLKGAGLNNVDMDLLFFLTSTLIKYFPKGLSYILAHELPWILRSVWAIARQWLSEEHKDLVKFSDSRTIYEYFTEENLPDFVGGTCKRDYRTVPSNSITILQAAKRWNLNEDECYRIRKKFAEHLPVSDVVD